MQKLEWTFHSKSLFFWTPLRKPQKKFFSLVARPLRPYPHPLPLGVSGHIFLGNFFSRASKIVFFLLARPVTPPPLRGRATKKITFFAASLNICPSCNYFFFDSNLLYKMSNYFLDRQYKNILSYSTICYLLDTLVTTLKRLWHHN